MADFLIGVISVAVLIIAEISCLEGFALFRIYSLTGTQRPGNILTDPERPYRYLLNYL